ncbi:hypothetical protein B0H19DRAFT_384323 [Mycena capillaripes]|nr:hypothetical protein B0H19DRAFT_384323 [Mycena capillaripes]
MIISIVCVDEIWYSIYLFGPKDNLPPGYLFLCPLTELETPLPACFRKFEWMAYWSLDSLGVERLTAAEAKTLGFPDILLRVRAWGSSWDSGVYAGIRRFHEDKRFDWGEIAGYPLFRVSFPSDALLADVHGSDTNDRDSNSDGVSPKGNSSHSADENYDMGVGDVQPHEVNSACI